ncbi:hypothetical protein RIF29_32995 [Crotalaria pallida]|uniref:Uncharacterized protein n=1 Tax=Crotalaria pallida TaxID=3830 RepID=A0AAN9E794_CROPI
MQANENLAIDLSILDDVEIEDLTSNQAEKVLETLDVIRSKLALKGSSDLVKDSAGSSQVRSAKKDASEALDPKNAAKSNSPIDEPEFVKPNVWESFDITKLRNAGAIKEVNEVIDDLTDNQLGKDKGTIQESPEEDAWTTVTRNRGTNLQKTAGS